LGKGKKTPEKRPKQEDRVRKMVQGGGSRISYEKPPDRRPQDGGKNVFDGVKKENPFNEGKAKESPEGAGSLDRLNELN